MIFDLTAAQLLGFLLAAVLVTLAPGPDNLGVLGLGVARGRRAGIGFGLGCALGCFTHTLWASLGISAILAASETAFTVLKQAGAAYLCWLVNYSRRLDQATGVLFIGLGIRLAMESRA